MGPLVPIAALAMALDASSAVSVARDGTIRILDTGAEPRSLPLVVPFGESDGTQPAAIARTGRGLIRVVWAADDAIGFYETAADGSEPRRETFPVPAPVRALGFSPSGRIAIAGCADGTLLSLDTATGEFGRRVSIGLLPAGALAVASDEGPVVASLSDSSVRRFDLATGIAYLVATERPVRHLAITSDGNTVLALGVAGTVYRWDVSLGGPPQLLELDEDRTGLAVDGSGDRVLVAAPDGTLWLHDLTGGPALEFGRARPSAAASLGPALAASEPQARPDSGGIVDNDVGFTVYRPRFLAPGVWGDLVVFAHKTDPVVDPGLGPIDPVQVVEKRAQEHFGGSAAPPARVDARRGLPRGERLRVVPDLPGIYCTPEEAPLEWWEPVHEVAFRLYAGPGLDGSTVRGAVRIFFGPMVIGEVSLSISVRYPGAGDEKSVAERAPRYRKIFPSYSHLDHAIVERFEDAARALGDQYLQDVLALRAGERWQPGIIELIREADVFQLFWSTNSMRSQFCRQEWEHALTLRRQAFVKPLYWEDPLPEDMVQGLPPAALRELHFVRVRSSRPPEPQPDAAATTRFFPDEIDAGPGRQATVRGLTQPVTQQIAADPVLQVQVEGTSHELHIGSSYRVGRDPQSEIVIADSRVSWMHAVLEAEQGVWYIEDRGSRNGTFAGSQRITRYQITQDCTLRLASASDGPALLCSPPRPASPPPPSPTIAVPSSGQTTIVGSPRPIPQRDAPPAPAPPPAPDSYAPPAEDSYAPPAPAGAAAPAEDAYSDRAGYAYTPSAPAGPSGPAYGQPWGAGYPPSRAAKRAPARRTLYVTAAVAALAVIVAVIILVLH